MWLPPTCGVPPAVPPTLPARRTARMHGHGVRRVAPVATGQSPHAVRASTANGHVATACNRLLGVERAKLRPADPSRPCAGPGRKAWPQARSEVKVPREPAGQKLPGSRRLVWQNARQVGPRPMAWRQCSARRSAGRDAPACPAQLLPDLLALSTHLTPVAIATRRTPFSFSPTAAAGRQIGPCSRAGQGTGHVRLTCAQIYPSPHGSSVNQ